MKIKHTLFIILILLTTNCGQAKKTKISKDSVEEGVENVNETAEDFTLDIKESTLNVDNFGQIYQESIEEIGKGIPHLIILNLANNNVIIKLSLDGQKWSDFSLDAISKNIYRCDAIQNMYIIIDPKAKDPIKAKIYRNKKYKIYYDYQLQLFNISEIT